MDDAQPSKSDLEARLHQTADTMSNRMDALREEVTTTGLSIRDWVAQHPLESVGGMLAAGLAVGLLFGGRSRRKRRATHQDLIDQYVDALSDEVKQAVKRGEDAPAALDKALRDRVPLVVYTAAPEPSASGGAIRSTLGGVLGTVLQTGLTLALRELIPALLEEADIEAMVSDLGSADDTA